MKAKITRTIDEGNSRLEPETISCCIFKITRYILLHCRIISWEIHPWTFELWREFLKPAILLDCSPTGEMRLGESLKLNLSAMTNELNNKSSMNEIIRSR